MSSKSTENTPAPAHRNGSDNGGGGNSGNGESRNLTNGGNNRNRNNRRQFRNNTSDTLRNFKGAIESLSVIGTKVEKSSQDFSKFTKAIHDHALTNFSYPKDISVAITDFKDPIRLVTADLPTKNKLMAEHHPQLIDETRTTEEKAKAAAYNSDLEETIGYMRKSVFAEFNKRKAVAESNITALWGIIFGQYIASLQQHIKAEEEYDQHICDAVWQRCTRSIAASKRLKYSSTNSS